MSRELRASVQRLVADGRSYRDVLDFTCGDLTPEQLLERVAPSRIQQALSHFTIGLTRLSLGDRGGARKHFSACARLRVIGHLEHNMSRALFSQLERDPTWPPWVPLVKQDRSSGTQ